jgi:hypothetical protein
MSTHGEVVTLNEAKQMTADYRRAAGANAIKAHLFSKGLVEDILNQSGCEGLRIYHGIENGEKVVVLVGTDANDEDMTGGVILERSTKCPPVCSGTSPLNA